MKHLNFLSKSSSRSCGHSSVTLASTVGSPSAHRRGTMLKLLSVLVLILTIGVGNVWGADASAYKQTTFSSSNNSASVQDYTSSWSNTTNSFTVNITNANNNKNGWSYIKMGRKNNASTGTIITDAAIDKRITKVELVIDAITTNNITSIKLYKATSKTGTWNEIGTFAKGTGTKAVNIAAADQAANLYYKIEVVCTSGSSNGLITISGLKFYRSTFTVSYNSNGGSGTMTDSSSPYDTASVVTVKSNTFTAPANKEFDEWKTGQSSGTSYAEGATFNITANTTLYAQWKDAAVACTNVISLSKGTESNGTVNSISSASVATCSETASDRRVTVTITPDACHNAPDALTYTGDGTATMQGTKTDLGNGSFSYVYQFAQNDNGSGTFGVTCAAKPAGKTVNFDAGPGVSASASLTETCDGSGVTLPDVDATGVCKGWTTFVGWRATAIATADSTTTNPGTILTAGSNYVPNSDGETLYAVYSKVKSGGTAEETASVSISSYATAHSWANSTQYTTVTVDANITATATGGGNTGKYYTSGTEWRFYQTENATLTISAATGCTLKSATFTYGVSNTGVLKDGSTAVSSGSAYTISGTSKTFSVGNSGSATNGQVKFTAISITYDKPASTTYYCSDPNCCTELGQINGSVTVSPSRNGATVSWEKVANASGYEYKLGDGAWTPATVSNMDNPSTTISDLEGATQYSINLRATGTGNYCSEGPALDNAVEFKTLSRVTAAVNDGVRGTAKVSLTSGSGWADYVDAADGTTIYLQATPSSASWILGSWDASNGTVASNQLTDWTGDVTVTANFAAAELPTLATPTGMSSSAVTATSATISWNAVDHASSYAISCMPNATQGDITVNDGVCSCTLTGLTAGTAYTWSVQAIGDNISYKSGAACADQNFTTEAKKPTLVEITTNPTKTTYNSGEKFNAAGLVVKVTYNNGDIDAAYTGYTLSPTTDDVLTPVNNKVTVSATLNEVTASADIDIVVNAKLTWKAAGAEDVYTYASSGKVVLPENNPSAPDCLGEFDTFQGWSAEAIATSVNVEPSYVTAETDAAADATYYAVFARMENGGTEDASSTFTVKTASAPGSPYNAEDGSTWTYNTTSGTINFENSNNASFVKSKSGWIQVALPSSATEAVSFVVTKTGNAWAGDAKAALSSGETSITDITGSALSYDFTNSNKSFGTYKLSNYSSTGKACWIDHITINYKKVGKTPVEWATTCCTSWDAPAISYDVPSGWKNGDDALAVAIASGATHGDVSYASSNTDVLTVAANGTITAVGPGTAKVTATWAGGLDNEVKYCEALSESATITVTGTVTIHFDGNGATSGSMSDQVATYNVAEALTANGFEKTGYTFYGWADTQEKANAGTRDYTNQQSVAFLANTTLYAVWTINSHAVTLTQPTVEEVAAGTIKANNSENPGSIAFGTTVTLTATENSSDLDGYVFDSWNVVGATLDDNSFTMPDNAVSVSAVYHHYTWNLTGYSVTTEPALSYTDAETFNKNGIVIEGDYKRSDTEDTKQITYAGTWTAKLGDDVIAQGYAFKLADNGKHLTFWIGEEKIYDKAIEVTEIPKDQFVDNLWGLTPAITVATGTYTTPSLSDQTIGEAATCRDHNIFMGWVELGVDPTKENIIAGGKTGMTANNKTYEAVWAKQVTGPVEHNIIYDWDESASGWSTGGNISSINSGKTGNCGSTSDGSLTTSASYAKPKVFSVYLKKTSGNTNNSWVIEYSKNNSTWNTVSSMSFSNISQTEWTLFSADVSSEIYDGSYFRFKKGNGNAVCLIDEVMLTYDQEDTYNADFITDCEVRHEISFDANGGEGSYESIEKKAGFVITLPDGSALSKEHYTFSGWTSYHYETTYAGGASYVVPEDDDILEAIWVENPKGTITYQGSNIQNSSVARYAGEPYDIRSNPTIISGPTNIKHIGWKRDGNDKLYVPGEHMVMPDPVENITYNVQFIEQMPLPASLNFSDGEWVLVTNENQLHAGDFVVIAANGVDKALGGQSNSNRAAVTVTRTDEGNKLVLNENINPLFLQFGYNDDEFALYDIANEGYLYAVSSSSNDLKNKADYDQNGSWKISIGDNAVATIKAQGDKTRNDLKYNSTATIFSCYASGQTAVQLYRYNGQLEVVVENENEIKASENYLTNADVVVKEGGVLTIDATSNLDNLTVEAGGEVSGESALTVNNLTIQTTSGSTVSQGKSGQLTGSVMPVVSGDLFIEIKLCEGAMDAEASGKWYCISAPFNVNMNGGFFWGDGTPMVLNTDFQLFEWDGDRRATGISGWKRVSGVMKAGIAYFIGFDDARSNQNIIKLKATNKTISNKSSINAPEHSSSVDDKYANWNGLANPNFRHIALNKNVQAFDYNVQSYNTYATGEYNFVVGTPFFIKETGDITIEAADNGSFRAPKREVEQLSYCVRIVREGKAGFDNQMYVRASEEASASYEEGHDLVTMNGESSNYGALLWTVNYGGKRLAIEEAPLVNDKASYALSLYAPANGTYRIETPTVREDADLYLTYEGAIIWNLSMGAYEAELAKGTNNGYGLLLVKKMPMTPTGVDEVQSDKGQCTKVIIDEHVYILRGGQMYDVTGKAVK